MKFAASRSSWHGQRGAGRTPRLDPFGKRLCLRVFLRERDAEVQRRCGVRLDHAEGVEAARDRPPAVEAPQQCRRLLDGDAPDLAFDETRDEASLRLDERDHLRRDSELRRGERGVVLDVAVDPEQLRVLAADAQDEQLARRRHLEVPVRDPAAEHLDRLDTARPHALGELQRAHARIRSPRGSNSGSAAISPATQSPKISTSMGRPGWT